MEHMSAVTDEIKVSSLIKLIKNCRKILKLLQFKKFQLINPDFLGFSKKVRHRIHYIFDNKTKNRI